MKKRPRRSVAKDLWHPIQRGSRPPPATHYQDHQLGSNIAEMSNNRTATAAVGSHSVREGKGLNWSSIWQRETLRMAKSLPIRAAAQVNPTLGGGGSPGVSFNHKKKKSPGESTTEANCPKYFCMAG